MRCFCQHGDYLRECGVILGKEFELPGWWVETYYREDWQGQDAGLITRALDEQTLLGEGLTLAEALHLFSEVVERLKGCRE